ncbi:unnamed protein product [Phytomonas sp. Hart1]|nr:unnamed protein product [Phytomonas sp. Hart1]|eukprot:CCW72196.1 unnamed protein product [Phytomonas sp. isolate Hart1]
MFSINPEFYERCMKPTNTIAMGMKTNHASSKCWEEQVEKEKRIAEHWEAEYNANHQTDRQEASNEIKGNSSSHRTPPLSTIQRVLAQERALKERYLSPERNPELYTHLYERPPPSLTGITNPTTTSSSPSREETIHNKAANPKMVEDNRHQHRSERYLFARAQLHSLDERYPNGPMTAAQNIGWNIGKNINKNKNNSPTSLGGMTAVADVKKLYGPRQLKKLAGGFRKPEDEDHAFLLGYDLIPK